LKVSPVIQVILSVLVSWLVCLILTETGVFPNDPNKWGYKARTDGRIDALYSSPWIRIPYPGMNTFINSFGRLEAQIFEINSESGNEEIFRILW